MPSNSFIRASHRAMVNPMSGRPTVFVAFWYRFFIMFFYNKATVVPVRSSSPKRYSVASSDPTIFNCSICNKPVDLKTAKTNEASQPVHEECYVLTQALMRSTKDITHPNITRPLRP